MSANKTKYENEDGEWGGEHLTVKHTFYSLQPEWKAETLCYIGVKQRLVLKAGRNIKWQMTVFAYLAASFSNMWILHILNFLWLNPRCELNTDIDVKVKKCTALKVFVIYFHTPSAENIRGKNVTYSSNQNHVTQGETMNRSIQWFRVWLAFGKCSIRISAGVVIIPVAERSC